MASGIVRISDVIVPSVFTPYVQNITTEKSALIQSGLMVRNAKLDEFCAGEGLTFNMPSWNDLDNDADRTSTDEVPYAYGGTADPTPNKIGTFQEVCVRVSRNNSWGASDLAATLVGADPMAAIANRVGAYWVRRLQAAIIAVVKGVIAGNTTNDSSDLQYDISGAGFVDGVTNFSAEAFLDTTLTMGDSMGDLTAVLVHSVVYNRMQKNNLIDFIPDSEGNVVIPTFLGRRVIVDDGMPHTGNVYDTWLFGAGAFSFGRGSPKVPTEIERFAGAGNGGGAETLYNRNEWIIHPSGFKYVGTAPNGGPTNAATTNNLAAGTSWTRVTPQRKQVRFARLVTREA